MSEKQREFLDRVDEAIKKIPDHKLEYLLGYADAMDDMNQKAEVMHANAERAEDEAAGQA